MIETKNSGQLEQCALMTAWEHLGHAASRSCPPPLLG